MEAAALGVPVGNLLSVVERPWGRQDCCRKALNMKCWEPSTDWVSFTSSNRKTDCRGQKCLRDGGCRVSIFFFLFQL